MRRKTFTATLSCLCVVLMACGTAFAQQGIRVPGYKGPVTPQALPDAPDAAPFFSNLTTEACSTCPYDAGNGGFVVLGPSNCDPNFPGLTEWLAYRFIAGHTGPLRTATVSITQDPNCTTNSPQFTLGIYSDNCVGGISSGPLALIVQANVNAAPAPCATARARFPAGTTLTQGVTYWLVASTSATQTGFTGVWWFANPALNYFNLNDGNGWLDGGGVGGFSVQ
jgi:hypothetical protein